MAARVFRPAQDMPEAADCPGGALFGPTGAQHVLLRSSSTCAQHQGHRSGETGSAHGLTSRFHARRAPSAGALPSFNEIGRRRVTLAGIIRLDRHVVLVAAKRSSAPPRHGEATGGASAVKHGPFGNYEEHCCSDLLAQSRHGGAHSMSCPRRDHAGQIWQ